MRDTCLGGLAALAVAGWLGATALPARAAAPPPKRGEWITYDEGGAKALIRELKQSNDEVVLRMALDTLARLGPTARPAVPAIVELLKRSRGKIQLDAALALLDLNTET